MYCGAVGCLLTFVCRGQFVAAEPVHVVLSGQVKSLSIMKASC